MSDILMKKISAIMTTGVFQETLSLHLIEGKLKYREASILRRWQSKRMLNRVSRLFDQAGKCSPKACELLKRFAVRTSNTPLDVNEFTGVRRQMRLFVKAINAANERSRLLGVGDYGFSDLVAIFQSAAGEMEKFCRFEQYRSTIHQIAMFFPRRHREEFVCDLVDDVQEFQAIGAWRIRISFHISWQLFLFIATSLKEATAKWVILVFSWLVGR